MVAVVQIHELNGAGETPTDKTSGTIRFQAIDTPNATNLNDPIPVPSSGQNYSFRKVLRLYLASGTFTQISNLRAYTDGVNSYGSGRKLWVNNPSSSQGSYTQPTAPSTSNDPPQWPSTTPMVNFFGYTSGAPWNMDGADAGPWTTADNATYIGDYLNLVAEIEAGSSQGVSGQEIFTFAFDEI